MKIEGDRIRQYVEARFGGQRMPFRAELSLRCPFHDDSTASFSFNIAKGVWCCHAGCGEGGLIDFEQKLNGGSREDAAHRIEEILGAGNLFESQKHKPSAIYKYVDAQGRELFEKLRYEPKRFVQRRQLTNGKYEYKLEGLEKPLYRLPEVLVAREIAVCEGEKDVENVRAALQGRGEKFAATTNFDGAGKWRDDYAKYFWGKRAVILADNDEAGKKHAEMVARSLHRTALGVKVVNLPGLAEHGDVSDYLQAHSAEELIAEIGKSPQWHPERTEHVMLMETMKFAVSASPEIDWLVEGVIQKAANGIITGYPKAAKSLAAIDLMMAISTGTPWLGFPTKRARCGLVSREDGPPMTKQRIGCLFRGGFRPGFEGQSWTNSREQTPTFLLSDDAQVNQLIAEFKMEQAEFVCFDVFRKLHQEDENDNTEMQKILDQLCRFQQEVGCAIALVHHLHANPTGPTFRRIRGATAIHGWTEWAMAITVTNEEEPDQRKWTRKIEFETKAACAHDPVFFQIAGQGEVLRLERVPDPGQMRGVAPSDYMNKYDQ